MNYSVNFYFPESNLSRLTMRELSVVMDAVTAARNAVNGVQNQPRCTGGALDEVEALQDSFNDCLELILQVAEAAKPTTLDEANVRAFIILHHETTYPDCLSEVMGKAHLLHAEYLDLKARIGDGQ